MRADELKIGDSFQGHKVADVTPLDHHVVIAVKIGPRDLVAKLRKETEV